MTPQAKYLAGSSVLVPLGLVLVSTLGGGSVSAWLPWAGVLMTLLPAVTLFYLLAARKCRWPPFPETRPGPNDAAEESLTAVLAGQTQVTTRTRTIETADPTSVEFQDICRRVLRHVLCSAENRDLCAKRRLVLAIDNLDRVGVTEGLSIWGTMRAFFEVPAEDQELLDRLWVLVPYDHDGIARLWRAESNEAGQLTKPFLEKTFQVRFHVPPPVLSDARAFMIRLLGQALPAHPKNLLSHSYIGS